MQHSGFFESEYDAESQSYDREYLAEQFAQYFSLFIGNGVFISPADQLKVIAGEGLKVIVTEGWAFINGFWYHNDTDLELEVLPNTTSFARTDSVMCRLNTAERAVTSLILSNETDVTRDGSYYDLKLAEINVAVASTTIINDMITDTRMNESVCGFVKGLVDVVSTEELFRQYEAAFSTWFERMKDQLSTDAAGNLQSQIDTINGTVISQWLASESFVFGGNRFLDSSGVVVDAQGKTLEEELTQLNSSLTANEINVPTSAWVSDSTSSDYGYKAVILSDRYTAAFIPQYVDLIPYDGSAFFSEDENNARGILNPNVVFSATGVTFYASEIPSVALKFRIGGEA